MLNSASSIRDWLPSFLVEGARTAWRDVAHVTRGFRGEKVMTYELRSARETDAGLSPRAVVTKRLRMLEAVMCTPSAVSVRFETEDGSPLHAEAGQFLTVHWPTGARIDKRAYSLACRADGSSRGRIVVKVVPGGLVSGALAANAGSLAHLDVTGPSGSFVLDASAHAHVFFAGGAGITPIASMLLTHVPDRPKERFVLVYGSRSLSECILHEEIAALARAYPDSLQIIWAFDVSDGLGAHAKTAHIGPLDAAATRRIVAAIAREVVDEATFYVCGPAPMMAATNAVLDERSVPASRVRTERFASPGGVVGTGVVAAKTVALRMKAGGRTLDVLGSTKQTILEAGLAAGIAMPYSCAMGGCAACKVRVTAGETQSEEPNCLDPAEAREGYVLACCTRPKSDVTVEVP
jgi:ring-1,2-phenylacetyl-CoA epoxidase subunit PaaE